MRTYVYIDGFNLYYRALKGTQFKWLDLHALIKCLLQPQHDILAIKYFTARASGIRDAQLPIRQETYTRALMHSISCLEIIYGSFQTHKKRLPLANPPAGGVGSAEILDTEEKGSDVNLAVHLVNDAWHGRFDCAVVVSNDSDLAEAM